MEEQVIGVEELNIDINKLTSTASMHIISKSSLRILRHEEQTFSRLERISMAPSFSRIMDMMSAGDSSQFLATSSELGLESMGVETIDTGPCVFVGES